MTEVTVFNPVYPAVAYAAV